MKTEAKHIEAVNLLISHRFSGLTLADIAAEVAVTDRTLRRWREDPDFQALYDRMLTDYIRDVESQPFAHRVDRIHELFRLYQATPDFTPGKNGVLYLADRKAKILKQIADEAEEGKIDEAVELVAQLREQLAELKGGPQLEVAGTAEGVFAIKCHTGV